MTDYHDPQYETFMANVPGKSMAMENARLRAENEQLRRERQWHVESIERLQAQIARMQDERWTPTIGDN